MATTGGAQANKNMELMFRWLSQLGIMKKQEAMQSRLIGERMTGYSQLEEERHTNRMAQINETLMNQLARDPAVERITGLIFKKRVKGDPVPDSLLQELRKTVKERSMLAHYTHTGRNIPPEEEYVFDNISEQAVVNFAGQGAATARAKIAQETAREALIVRGYEADTGRIQAITSSQRLGLDRLKTTLQQTKTKDEYYKLIHSNKIAPLQSFLNRYIGKEKALANILNDPMTSELGQMLSMAIFAKDSKDAPITEQNLLQLKKQVDLLDTKALKGQLTGDELAWLSDAYDLFMQQTYLEGIPEAEVPTDTQTATSQTGEKVALINGQWVLIKKK